MRDADGHTIVCRCEEVSLKTIKETASEFKCSAREIKLRTRAAMGYCGGRTCRSMIDRVVQEINKDSIPDEIPLSFRPPIRPVTFGILGGDES